MSDPLSLMVCDGARVPPHHHVATAPVNQELALTESPPGTSFAPFRGHLSRPACSHVKQLAKQAGDRSDPGRTIVQAGFFYGLISVRESSLPGGRCRDDRPAVDIEPCDSQRRSRP